MRLSTCRCDCQWELMTGCTFSLPPVISTIPSCSPLHVNSPGIALFFFFSFPISEFRPSCSKFLRSCPAFVVAPSFLFVALPLMQTRLVTIMEKAAGEVHFGPDLGLVALRLSSIKGKGMEYIFARLSSRYHLGVYRQVFFLPTKYTSIAYLGCLF